MAVIKRTCCSLYTDAQYQAAVSRLFCFDGNVVCSAAIHNRLQRFRCLLFFQQTDPFQVFLALQQMQQ